MKTCFKCQKEKPNNHFNKNKSKKDGLSSSCKDCHSSYNKNHYQSNKKYYKNKSHNHKTKIQEFVREYKEKNPCKDCKKFWPFYVMDFDHCRGKKIANICYISNRNTSMVKLLEEMKKCDLVCSNCHRTRTYLRIISEKDDHATHRR